jgi:hypothetical protein
MARTSTSSDKSSSRSSDAQRQEMDAYALLEEDHKRVQKLFKEFEGRPRGPRGHAPAGRDRLRRARDPRRLEEELFYPMLSAALEEDDQELVAEAHVEHDSAKQLIEQLRSLQPGDPMYAATFTVLGGTSIITSKRSARRSSSRRSAPRSTPTSWASSSRSASRRCRKAAAGAVTASRSAPVAAAPMIKCRPRRWIANRSRNGPAAAGAGDREHRRLIHPKLLKTAQ